MKEEQYTAAHEVKGHGHTLAHRHVCARIPNACLPASGVPGPYTSEKSTTPQPRVKRSREAANNESLLTCTATTQVLLPHSRDVKLEHISLSSDFLAVFERSGGLQVRACFFKSCCGPDQK